MSEPWLHICAPTPSLVQIRRSWCPICKKRRFFLDVFTAWYGLDSVCLKCGDRWMDGELLLRPFMRGWRKQSVARAKQRYRLWKSTLCVKQI